MKVLLLSLLLALSLTGCNKVSLSIVPGHTTSGSSIKSVSSSSSGVVHGVGSTISLEVDFDTPVDVIGNPRLMLQTDQGARYADCASGTSLPVMICNYVVQAGESNLTLNYVDTNSLDLNGGRILRTDSSEEITDLTLPPTSSPQSLASSSVSIDGVPPAIALVTPPSNDTYLVGDHLDFTVNFSEPVSLTSGAPKIQFNLGGTIREAICETCDDETSSWKLRYTIQASDSTDSDGIELISPMDEFGGIIDVAGNAMTAGTFPAVDTTQVRVNTAAPTLVISDAVTYDYDDVVVGSTKDHVFTVTNTGGQTATSIALASALSSPYSFKGGSFPGTGESNLCGSTLAGGQTCTVVVSFAPTAAGTANESLEIEYNDGSATQTALRNMTGTGILGILISETDAYDFGGILVGSSDSHVFTLTNNAGATLSNITITGLAAPFAVVADTDTTCSPLTGFSLTHTSSCNIKVSFGPTASGAADDIIVINYDLGATTGLQSSREIEGQGLLPGFNGNVESVAFARDGSGDIIVVGPFTEYNGVTANRIIRLKSDLSVAPGWNSGSGFNDAADTVVPSADGDYLYVGGNFTSYNGTSVARIAKLNALTGAVVSGWTGACGNRVYAVKEAADGSGDIYVGGAFVDCGGVSKSRIARLNSDGSVDTDFDVGTGFSGTHVLDIATLHDGSGDIVAVGHNLTSYNGTTLKGPVRIRPNGGIAPGFNTTDGSDSGPFTVETSSGNKDQIYFGGYYPTYAGTNLYARLAVTDGNGDLDYTFDTEDTVLNWKHAMGGQPWSIKTATDGSGDIFIGGTDFTHYRGVNANYLVRVGNDGTFKNTGLHDYFGKFDGTIRRVDVSQDGSGKIVVGGSFNNYDGAQASKVKILDTLVSGTSPVITQVASSGGNKTYQEGEAIPFEITFSESVTISGGAAKLRLKFDNAIREADCDPQTGTVISCSYTTQSGDEVGHLTYTTDRALYSPAGVSILQTSVPNNPATLVLPVPGLPNSLSANNTIAAVLPSLPDPLHSPIIELIGNTEIALEVGQTYNEPGTVVYDDVDTGLTTVIGGDTVNTSVPGVYTITYNTVDNDGYIAHQVTRQVTVVPPGTLADSELIIEPTMPAHAKEYVGAAITYRPRDYFNTNAKLPVIFSFHGAGEYTGGGQYLNYSQFVNAGLQKYLHDGGDVPFLVFAPQMIFNFNQTVRSVAVAKYMEHMLELYKDRIDFKRIYLTGYSNGGMGTWHFASELPHRFAGIVPISGFQDGQKAALDFSALGEIPIWAFHNDGDPTVGIDTGLGSPNRGTREIINLINATGPSRTPKFTIWPDAVHDGWTRVYNSSGLTTETPNNIWDWFLSQHLTLRDDRVIPLYTASPTVIAYGDAVKFKTSADKEAILYYSIKASGPAPSISEIKSGAGAVAHGYQRLYGNQDKQFLVEGLSENTAYNAYFVLEDLHGRNSGGTTTVSFTTLTSAGYSKEVKINAIQASTDTTGLDPSWVSLDPANANFPVTVNGWVLTKATASFGGSVANGPSTDNVYPGLVSGTYWETGFNTHYAWVQFSDLDPDKIYEIEALSSKNTANPHPVHYWVGSVEKVLDAQNNTTNVVHFDNVVPELDRQGNVLIRLNFYNPSLDNGFRPLINGFILREKDFN